MLLVLLKNQVQELDRGGKSDMKIICYWAYAVKEPDFWHGIKQTYFQLLFMFSLESHERRIYVVVFLLARPYD